jgi:hypothetical protein
MSARSLSLLVRSCVLWAAVAACLWLPATAVGAGSAPVPAERQLLGFLQEGQELFHRAANTDDPQEAAVLYRRALDRFVTVADQGGVRNAELYYNIGNTYFRLGSVGKAILYYRRAELLDPADPNLRHNLAYVRSQREDGMPPDQLSRLARVLFFWHFLLSPAARLYVFAAAFAAACAAGALALVGGVKFPLVGRLRIALPALRRPLLPVLVTGVVALLLLGSVVAGEVSQRTSRAGVIVAEEVVVRKGDGTAYQPSFVDPLHQGTEFLLLEDRAGWYHVRFTDGRTGWLPASAAEMVLGPRS